MKNAIILADDLTGANDTALQVAKTGINTKVLIQEPFHFASNQKQHVYVINTETRSLEVNEARKKLKNLASQINKLDFSFYYKKIDSTLRGNVGAEIETLIENIDFDCAVVAPAYPKNGRITVGGYHLVHQKLLTDTEFAKDPKTPVHHSVVSKELELQMKQEVTHINIEFIKKNKLSKILKNMSDFGKKCFTFDCITDDDFDTIISETEQVFKRILWVGSAGLMSSLAKRFKSEDNMMQNQSLKNKHPNLVVAGSVSEKTREQVDYLKSQGYALLTLHPNELLDENFSTDCLPNMLLKAATIIQQNKHLVITTNSSTEARNEFAEYLQKNDLSKEEAGNQIAKHLGLLASKLIKKHSFASLFLTGGDIAYYTCTQLQIKALKIIGEAEEGIPICKIADSESNDLPIITKAGAFGDRFSIYNSLIKVKEFIN